MIDEKKLIEDLNKYARENFHLNDEFEWVLEGMIKALDIVERQPKVGEWIPISENPNGEGTYIVAWLPAFKDEKGKKIALPCPYPHFYTLGDYYDDEWDVKIPSAYYEYILLAWMPLPAPYNADMRKKVE